ncbi:unnamed protein product [Pedinophyceae sp. YPF-701]|nr:unnamed protein product [Pedinophyceae sp. YPF-701]
MSALLSSAAVRATPVARVSNGAKVCMANKKVYHVEIARRDGESTDVMLRKFRTAVNSANIVNECRRRRTFENGQDLKKRKAKEMPIKRRKERMSRYRTMDQAVQSSAGIVEVGPFSDLFGSDQDVFAGSEVGSQ